MLPSRKLEAQMNRLPSPCREYTSMHFYAGLSQNEIARLFDVAQPSVSYQIQRAIQRLQYLLTLPPDQDVEESLKTFFDGDPLRGKVMISMYFTTSQSETGRVLGMRQPTVRWRFLKGLRALDEADHEYAWIFRRIKDSPGQLATQTPPRRNT